MLRLLNWEEVVLPRGPTFGVDLAGSKLSASSDAFKTCNVFKKSIYNSNNRNHVHDICIISYKKMRNYALI